MDTYITDKLEANAKSQSLASRNPVNAREMADEIRGEAQGVFFWVFLVVPSLLVGLQKHDDIAMLRRRLRDIPPDLDG